MDRGVDQSRKEFIAEMGVRERGTNPARSFEPPARYEELCHAGLLLRKCRAFPEISNANGSVKVMAFRGQALWTRFPNQLRLRHRSVVSSAAEFCLEGPGNVEAHSIPLPSGGFLAFAFARTSRASAFPRVFSFVPRSDRPPLFPSSHPRGQRGIYC